MEPTVYDLKQFTWNKAENTLHGEAPYLVGMLPDGHFHPCAFPSVKEQFIIKNFETGGFRRFRFLKETPGFYIFESEDGIKCEVCLDADWFDPSPFDL